MLFCLAFQLASQTHSKAKEILMLLNLSLEVELELYWGWNDSTAILKYKL